VGVVRRTSTTGQQLMLNSDMMLIKDVFAGSAQTKGEPTCTYDTCPASPTLPIAQEFAADNDLFVKEFTRAYVKMLTKGYDICTLAVVPSKGSGPEVDAVYEIPAVNAACGVVSPASEPTTAGVFDDPSVAPAPGPVAGTGALPAEAAGSPSADAAVPPASPTAGAGAADSSTRGGTTSEGPPSDVQVEGSPAGSTSGTAAHTGIAMALLVAAFPVLL
jgi:hypothetical protein